jgi:hypothetical protein
MLLVIMPVFGISTPIASAAAEPPVASREAGALSTPSGGASWASFKQIDVAEQRSSRDVFVARNAERERAAGSPAAALTRSEQSGRPEGCYADAIGASVSGTVHVLEVCPGRGGYQGGLTAEAFGITTLALRDPVTGAPLPTAEGGGEELIAIDPRALAERAAAALDLPEPAIRMSPADDQVVRLASWLWIPSQQWEPRQVSASAGPVTSTVTATPVRLTWDMGNGDQVSCDGPGTPYRSAGATQVDTSGCQYTYRHSSAGQPDEAYEVTATIAWELTWTATGAAGGGSLGTVTMSASQPVRVTEIQALVQ